MSRSGVQERTIQRLLGQADENPEEIETQDGGDPKVSEPIEGDSLNSNATVTLSKGRHRLKGDRVFC